MNGSIITILIDKGFGFIRGDDMVSRFFHAKDVVPRRAFDLMHEGQHVRFDPIDMGEQNPAMVKGNGLKAANVHALEE